MRGEATEPGALVSGTEERGGTVPAHVRHESEEVVHRLVELRKRMVRDRLGGRVSASNVRISEEGFAYGWVAHVGT